MKRLKRITCMTVLIAVVAIAGSTTAATIHVGDGGDYPTIQSGIDAASPGDIVLVHCGVYYEHDIVMRSGLVLRSETGDADCVTIDAEDAGTVLLAWELEDAITVEGFRIENGCNAHGSAGMLIQYTDATIRNCCFANNVGGGNLMPSFGALTAVLGTFRITDCVFTGNQSGHASGAISIVLSNDAILTRCTIMDNEGSCGGIGLHGGHYELFECYIADNYGYHFGGGLTMNGQGGDVEVFLTNCTITGNAASEGGGVYIDSDSELIAFNTDIRDNIADIGPGGYCAESTATLLTCCDIVEDQWFIEEGAAWELDNSDCTVTNEQMTWGGVKSLYK